MRKMLESKKEADARQTTKKNEVLCSIQWTCVRACVRMYVCVCVCTYAHACMHIHATVCVCAYAQSIIQTSFSELVIHPTHA